MNRGKIFALLLLFQLFPVQSQIAADQTYREIREDAENRYGPSADLLNGEKYQYSYKTTRGDPFLWAHDGSEASVQIKGRMYENQQIRYDIYNQLMVLDFVDRSGGPGSVVLSMEWVDHLMIDGLLFKKFPDENGAEQFGQVIFEGNVSCVYFWEKKYLPDLHEGEKQYYFSDPIRQPFILVNGQACPYSGNRSFLMCFSKQNQAQFKTYFKEKRIKVKKASDQDMIWLMERINQSSGYED